jgi:hypothetical protein
MRCPFSVCCVFASCCPVMDPNSVLCFHAHVLTDCQLSHNWIHCSNCPAYITSWMDLTEDTVPLLLFPVVVMQTCFFAKPLLINGCCIFHISRLLPSSRSTCHSMFPQNFVLWFLNCMFLPHMRPYFHSYKAVRAINGYKYINHSTAYNW